MEWQVEYYKKENGNIPVIDYLLSIDVKIMQKPLVKSNCLKSMDLNYENLM